MKTLVAILADIRLAHTVFALPFALIGLLIGTKGEVPEGMLLLRILGAMLLARSAAMAVNRLADQQFDATNPRTEGRALPSGVVPRYAMGLFALVSSAGFIGISATFGNLCLWLSVPVLLVLFLYSYTKRFTAAAHLFVGLALALSPPAAYLAARGSIDSDVTPVLWLAASVLLWVAGFDVIYACQDREHDLQEGLHSIPARWGIARALLLSRFLHGAMLVTLSLSAVTGYFGPLTWTAIGLVACLLIMEHRLVSGSGLERVNLAFFTMNGVVSLLYASLVGLDLLWR